MKIYRHLTINSEALLDRGVVEVIEERSWQYEGPIARACGGDANSGEKQQLAQSQVKLNTDLDNTFNTDQQLTQPFWESQLSNGLPYFNSMIDYSNGTLAQAAAPQRAQLLQNLAGFGDTLPDGFKQQQLTDFNAQLARAFDANVTSAQQQQYGAKQQAAEALNPLQYAQTGNQTASSVLSSPAVNSGGVGNFLGGLASGVLSSAKVGSGSLPGMAWSL